MPQDRGIACCTKYLLRPWRVSVLYYLGILPDVKKHSVFAPLCSALSVALHRLKTGCCERYPGCCLWWTEPLPALPGAAAHQYLHRALRNTWEGKQPFFHELCFVMKISSVTPNLAISTAANGAFLERLHF